MDDSKIIELLFARDEGGIEELNRKYGRHAAVVAMSILRSSRDSEECVNDTWLKTWNSIPPNKPENLRAYISKIVRNLCLDRLRNMDAKKRPDAYLELREELTQVFDDNVEDRLEQRLMADAINEFLGMLSTDHRLLFVGRYWHMQSIKELCSLCGLSESNAKVTLHRLREQLKEFLKEEGFEI